MTIYYLNLIETDMNKAQSKANPDCCRIMAKMGMKEVPIRSFRTSNNRWNYLCEGLQFPKLFTLPKGSTLIINYPFYIAFYSWLKVLELAKARRQLKLVFIIHDLDSIRYGDDTALRRDKRMFAAADGVVIQNDQMKAYAVDHLGAQADQLVSLEVFDYLLQSDVQKEKEDQMAAANRSHVVNISGNLDPNKSSYIYQLAQLKPSHYDIHLFGPNYDVSQSNEEAVNYHGSFSPEEVPLQLVDGFGLVWDGTSLDTCDGPTGNYLRYNDPHKFSLYLVSGLPVIIWEEAALADLVEREGIGFTIGSLRELDDRFAQLDEAEYQAMRSRAQAMAKKLTSGQMLEKALTQVLNELN